MYAELVHSPDENGWYASVFDKRGKDRGQTELYRSKAEAAIEAKVLARRMRRKH